MITVVEPNYNHYARIKAITADEAQWLLTIFELRDREFSDQNEFDKSADEEHQSAFKVLVEAIENGDLKYNSDPFALDTDESGRKTYCFSKIRIETADFCSWADEMEYNLPDKLAKLVNDNVNNNGNEEQEGQIAGVVQETTEAQETKCAFLAEETQKTGAEDVKCEKENQTGSETIQNSDNNDGGRPEGSLAEAVRYTYQKLQQDKDEVWRLNKGKVRDFIEFLKYMATEGHPKSDKLVMERIATVKSPHSGDCTIKTQDRWDLISIGKRSGVSRVYKSRHVTRILMRLREEANCTE
jgi:hypothetical protein